MENTKKTCRKINTIQEMAMSQTQNLIFKTKLETNIVTNMCIDCNQHKYKYIAKHYNKAKYSL